MKGLFINFFVGIFYLVLLNLIFNNCSGGDMIYLLFSWFVIIIHFSTLWFKRQTVVFRIWQIGGIFLVIIFLFLLINYTNQQKEESVKFEISSSLQSLE